MNKTLLLAALLLTPSLALATNETATVDLNQNPVVIGISEDNSEIRRIKTTDDGYLVIKSTPAGVELGTMTVISDGWFVPVQSTGTCASGSATLAIAQSVVRKASLFCNEGTEPVRIGDSSVTSSKGVKVQHTTCVPLDTELYPFRGALYCSSTTGAAQAFSGLQGF